MSGSGLNNLFVGNICFPKLANLQPLAWKLKISSQTIQQFKPDPNFSPRYYSICIVSCQKAKLFKPDPFRANLTRWSTLLLPIIISQQFNNSSLTPILVPDITVFVLLAARKLNYSSLVPCSYWFDFTRLKCYAFSAVGAGARGERDITQASGA